MRWQPVKGEDQPLSLPAKADFERVVLPHLDAAYNLARWLVRDATLAQDVVQDANIRALLYYRSYRGGDARAWLLRIVRNTAYDALAARTRSATAALDDPAMNAAGHARDAADDPEMALAGRQRSAELAVALAALPVELRECIVLHELEELSYKDIAIVIGTPIGTVMSRLWRARQALAQGRMERGHQ